MLRSQEAINEQALLMQRGGAIFLGNWVLDSKMEQLEKELVDRKPKVKNEGMKCTTISYGIDLDSDTSKALVTLKRLRCLCKEEVEWLSSARLCSGE